MKHSAAEAKIASSMIKGETPFDLAKTKEIYATFATDAAAMPTLFPDCSKTGDHTTAAPAIWEKPDDFKAAIAKFTADIKAAQDSTKDLDSLKANFPGDRQRLRLLPSDLPRKTELKISPIEDKGGRPRGRAALSFLL